MSGLGNVVPFTKGSVSGYLHRTGTSAGSGLVLTHGAGGNCEAPLLVQVASAFASSGISVLRVDLPFRRKKRFGPPYPATAAHDRSGLRDAVIAMRELVSGPVYLGGHSYGGRQASILASETPDLAAALLLLSYPLHPPRKPEELRTGHFHKLQTPALFVHGTADPFGTPDEMRAALGLIPAAKDLVLVGGAGHDLARGEFDADGLIIRNPIFTGAS